MTSMIGRDESTKSTNVLGEFRREFKRYTSQKQRFALFLFVVAALSISLGVLAGYFLAS